ncbi:MAG: hypothetical protein HYU39_06415 [Thaumarchaeota archaeon]|nr:hypothetical protein [Nitrososphaerota archaeon]
MSTILLYKEKKESLRKVSEFKKKTGSLDVSRSIEKIPSDYDGKLAYDLLNRIFGGGGPIVFRGLAENQLQEMFGGGSKAILHMLNVYASVKAVRRVEKGLHEASKKARANDERWNRVAQALEEPSYPLEKLDF